MAKLQGAPVSGLRKFGVPPGGAFDRESLALANAIAGNEQDAVALELTLASARFEAEANLTIALVGAETELKINGQRKRAQASFNLKAGDQISVLPGKRGARLYLSTPGGFVEDNDPHAFRPGAAEAHKNLRLAAAPRSIADAPICILPGPQAELFGEQALPILTVSNDSNRVGVRFEEAVYPHSVELPSEPACTGAIQVTREGKLIVVGPDGPTIGGYPKLAVVCDSSLDAIGQLRPGDRRQLRWVTYEEASELRNLAREDMRRRITQIQIAAGTVR